MPRILRVTVRKTISENAAPSPAPRAIFVARRARVFVLGGMSAIPTVVIRHANERLSKCSLTPLHGRPEIQFLTAKGEMRFDATDHIVLAVDAPVLSTADAGKPLLLLDSTWRLLPKLLHRLDGTPVYRSLPAGVRTAYPRVSKVTADPLGGLASVEALYLARKMLGDDDLSLLENYHWRDAFLAQFESAS